MTPEQVEIVQKSLDKMRPKMRFLVDTFYEELFRRQPRFRRMFPTDMTNQRNKLIQTLTYSVNGLRFPSTIIPAVEKLGVSHRAYSVDAEQYMIVGEALLYAISEVRGAEITRTERDAWAACYELLSSTMQRAAAAAA